MALFTSKADRDLNILTQFYQIEIDKPPTSEQASDASMAIGHLWGRYLMSPHSELLWWVNHQRERFDGTLTSWPDDPLNLDYPELFWDLAGVHENICALMRCAADGVAPPIYQVGIFNDWLNETLTPPWVSWVNPNEINISLRHLTIWQQAVHHPIAFEMLKALQQQTLVRCQSCGSVFVASRDGQEFCSYRCRARVGSRRRYAEKMEGYPVRNKRVVKLKT